MVSLPAGDDVELLSYDSSPEGFAKSWVERYPQPEEKYKALMDLYKKDLRHFPVN